MATQSRLYRYLVWPTAHLWLVGLLAIMASADDDVRVEIVYQDLVSGQPRAISIRDATITPDTLAAWNRKSIRAIAFRNCRIRSTEVLNEFSLGSCELEGCEFVQGFAAFAAQKELHSLRIRQCNVGDEDLLFLPSLQRLRYLSLSHVAITDLCLNTVAQCDGLEVLILDGTQVSDLSRLKRLKRLKTLSLRNTGVINDSLSSLSELPRLEYLYLDDTAISNTGLVYLAECKNLVQLSLDGTRIDADSLRVLSRVPEQAEIYLARTAVSPEDAFGFTLRRSSDEYDKSLAEAIERLERMVGSWTIENENKLAVRLERCALSDAELQVLTELDRICKLSLVGSQVGPAWLQKLELAGVVKHIEELDLSDTGTDDEDLQIIARFPKLRKLNVAKTRVTNSGLTAFKKRTLGSVKVEK